MDAAKADFIRTAFVPLLHTIPADAVPHWGKMRVQQMIEHFTQAVNIAAGKQPNVSIITPVEQLSRMQAFIRSDKPFRENTRNPLLPETPPPVHHASMPEALDELQAAIDGFFNYFSGNEKATTRNPIFGDLDFDMNIQLLHKHAVHHLRQFGMEAAPV